MWLPSRSVLLTATAWLALAGINGNAPRANLRVMLPGRFAPVRESCGTGKDLVVQALERIQANSSSAQLVDADELLKRASDLCSESGDAWYYRSLVEAKLGRVRIATFAMQNAQSFSSDALNEGLNPFVLATPGTNGAAPPAKVRQKWALIIGIGDFADPNIEPLRYSMGDAESFRDVLLDAKGGGFKAGNVRLLTNQDATLRGIKEGINWLARSAAPDDMVVVYVATHGSSRDLDTVGANYIITHDTEVGANINPDSLYATALPMVELANAVATRVKARRTAVFLDTCYSGGSTEAGGKLLAPGVATASVSAATLEHISQGTGRIILTASRTDEESLESDTLHHGYFTYFLVQALRDRPEQPLSRVFAYVQQHVAEKVAADYKQYNLHQDPVMSRSADDADFSLVAGGEGATASVAKSAAGVKGLR
jgi:uncharacterized caspase-like protein